MSDGPFKNSKLPKCWRRFGDAVRNDAVDDDERCARGSHAVLNDVLSADTANALMGDLQSFASREQLDMEPIAAVEKIFDRYGKTPFFDLLQRELVFQLSKKIPPMDALPQAMMNALQGDISESKNRFQEECIHLAEAGEMTHAERDISIERANAVFARLDVNEICDAVFDGKKNVFRKKYGNKEGLYEGPDM